MATYLMVTRTTEAAQLDLRQALMDEWPTLRWQGPPSRLAGGEYVGVFSAPPQCTLPRLRHFLHMHAIRHDEIWPAPTRADLHEVIEATENPPTPGP